MDEAAKINHNHTILTMMKQFHTDGKYYDVQLQVGTKQFKCQRSLLAANSVYFDTMFGSDFQESDATVDQPITLHEVDATAFEEILNYIYIGELCAITECNVLQFLIMNDFLLLRFPHVKEQCVEYLKSRSQKPEPISNAFDLFSFVHMKAEKTLVDVLSTHICQHLYHYSKDEKFLQISFEDLNALLKFSKNYISPLPGSQNIILKIVHNWINHDRKGRAEYRSELMKDINFSNVSSNFASSLIKRLETIADELVNLSSDKSPSEVKTLEMGIDIDVTCGDSRLNATISLVKNVSEISVYEFVYSSSSIISNLSWKVKVERTVFGLSVFLYCDGIPHYYSRWNCCARATFTLVSHKEGKENFIVRGNPHIYESKTNTGFGRKQFLKWGDLINPENGYLKDNFFTINVDVHADVPF